jgi:hypothetical protein
MTSQRETTRSNELLRSLDEIDIELAYKVAREIADKTNEEKETVVGVARFSSSI